MLHREEDEDGEREDTCFMMRTSSIPTHLKGSLEAGMLLLQMVLRLAPGSDGAPMECDDVEVGVQEQDARRVYGGHIQLDGLGVRYPDLVGYQLWLQHQQRFTRDLLVQHQPAEGRLIWTVAKHLHQHVFLSIPPPIEDTVVCFNFVKIRYRFESLLFSFSLPASADFLSVQHCCLTVHGSAVVLLDVLAMCVPPLFSTSLQEDAFSGQEAASANLLVRHTDNHHFCQ